jgi:IMP dehydrogenase
MKIRDMLEQLGLPVRTLALDSTVDQAVMQMSSEGAGALIVMEADRPVGIFSERDVLRAYRKRQGADLASLPVQDVMTNRLITVAVSEDVRSALIVMLKARIRHLPVVDAGRLVGLLAMEDLAAYTLQALDSEIAHLKDYISDLHDAGRD